MARVSKPAFVVWTRDTADEDSWRVELETDDLAAAEALAARLGTDDVIATVYERGRFEAGGREHTDGLMYWWSPSYDEAMGGRPAGRGQGWSDTHGCFVDYAALGSGAMTSARSGALVPTSPRRRYRIVQCFECGLELPQNEAFRHERKVEVGSSSGTYRSGSSFTQRVSSRSFSNSSTSRSSWSSGRTYYKRETVWLCQEHHDAQVEADKAGWRQLKRMLVSGAVLVVLLLILHAGK